MTLIKDNTTWKETDWRDLMGGLAQACHGWMSRTAFAQTFKRTVGTSAIEYLTRWRMTLAISRLRNTKMPMSELALSVGYESESAFSTAFKHMWGSSPRKYVRDS